MLHLSEYRKKGDLFRNFIKKETLFLGMRVLGIVSYKWPSVKSKLVLLMDGVWKGFENSGIVVFIFN